jgi:hypothetical protein
MMRVIEISSDRGTRVNGISKRDGIACHEQTHTLCITPREASAKIAQENRETFGTKLEKKRRIRQLQEPNPLKVLILVLKVFVSNL